MKRQRRDRTHSADRRCDQHQSPSCVITHPRLVACDHAPTRRIDGGYPGRSMDTACPVVSSSESTDAVPDVFDRTKRAGSAANKAMRPSGSSIAKIYDRTSDV